MWTLKHIRKWFPIRGSRNYGNYENRIGIREVVGHGCNGMYVYKDDAHFPFPAIRFKEETPEIQKLREKEEGPWKSLSLEEKKALYRASFCQTFAEFQHPTGQWKFILGVVFLGLSFPFWMQMFYFNFVKEPFPDSLLPENQLAQLQRMLDLKALRIKEKCDWRQLSCEEKKALYRNSFCQTYAEFQHPTGQWKFIVGCGLFGVSFGFWMTMFCHYYVFEPLPISLSEVSQKAQLMRMIDLRVNVVDGLASYWDYVHTCWKWETPPEEDIPKEVPKDETKK